MYKQQCISFTSSRVLLSFPVKSKHSPACYWYSQCSTLTQINSVHSGSGYHNSQQVIIAPGTATRYAPAIGSLTCSGQVLSPHMAKLQAASVPIAYGSWDRQTEGSQYLLKPCSLQQGRKNAMRNCSSQIHSFQLSTSDVPSHKRFAINQSETDKMMANWCTHLSSPQLQIIVNLH